LPSLKRSQIENALQGEDCDGDHWLLLYEGARQGYLSNSFKAMVSKNLLMGQLLSSKVAFYRTQMPAYAMLLHPGGAPEWVIKAWVKGGSPPTATPPMPEEIAADLAKLATRAKTPMDLVRDLLDKFSEPLAAHEPYE
jgi:hypothetical protein